MDPTELQGEARSAKYGKRRQVAVRVAPMRAAAFGYKTGDEMIRPDSIRAEIR